MLQEGVSLKPYNTFGIDVSAKYFASFSNLEALKNMLSVAKNYGPALVIGGGSNILLTRNVDGLVLHNRICGIELVATDDEHIYVKAGAGENWHQFVLYCIAQGYAGVENLSLIPGSVGASPMQNIGAYGVELKDVFYELEALHIGDGTVHRFGNEDCAFGYRESVFKKELKGQFIITSVTFRLDKNPKFNTSYGAIGQELEMMGATDLSIGLISQAVINIRSSKLPDWKIIGNAGSFFKNPVIGNEQFADIKEAFPQVVAFPAAAQTTKLAAGWLIEQCGWKGFRRGDAGCYSKQALVLVNYGKAAGSEIFELSQSIIESVHQKFGVLLEREVNIV